MTEGGCGVGEGRYYASDAAEGKSINMIHQVSVFSPFESSHPISSTQKLVHVLFKTKKKNNAIIMQLNLSQLNSRWGINTQREHTNSLSVLKQTLSLGWWYDMNISLMKM